MTSYLSDNFQFIFSCWSI